MSHIFSRFPRAAGRVTVVMTALGAAASFLFASSVLRLSAAWDHIATISFVLFLVLAATGLVELIRREVPTVGSLARILGVVFAVHFGILFAVWLYGADVSSLWVPDSVNHHVPMANKFVEVLRSGSSERMVEWLWQSDGPLTHSVAGVFFILFGASAVSTGAALLIFKLATTVFIYGLGRDLFGDKKWGLVAAVIYGLMPTVLFYTISYYKEAAVQMLVAGVLWGVTSVLNFRRSAAVVGIVASVFLIRERFYLVPALALPAFFVSLLQLARNRKNHGPIRLGLLVFVVVLLGLFYLVYDERYLVSELPRVLQLTRENLNSLPGVDPAFNRDLFYPLALIKSYFTPFFGWRKFVMFFDFSFLLLWGSFVHQAVSLIAAVEGWRRCRERWSVHLMFWTPFFILLCALAYLAPYSGRQRDSLYPVIAVYAAAAICRRFSIADRRKDGYV